IQSRRLETATVYTILRAAVLCNFRTDRRGPSFSCRSQHACACLERARLLHQYALDRASADAQRLADLQYARAALVQAQDAFFQLGPAHTPARFICASFAVLL